MTGVKAEDATPLATSELADWLERRIGARAPAAAVRFGDAEARLLMADPADTAWMDDTVRKLRIETGLSFATEAVLELKDLVAFAYDQADVLGIGFSDQFIDEHKMWMRRLAEVYAERVAAGRRPPAQLAHCLFSHQIVDALPTMLAGRRVSAISCRDIKAPLEAGWGLGEVAVYQVPSQHSVRDVDGDYEAALHDEPIWPNAHARVREALTVREPGEVFLVGAGLFGKDLCIRVREMGGIAIDMGSAFDRIAGKITRGPRRRLIELRARGVSVDEIASHFSQIYRVEVTREMVLEAMAECV